MPLIDSSNLNGIYLRNYVDPLKDPANIYFQGLNWSASLYYEKGPFTNNSSLVSIQTDQTGGGYSIFRIVLNASSEVLISFSSNYWGTTTYNSGVVLPAAFTNVFVVRDGPTLIIYFNGSEVYRKTNIFKTGVRINGGGPFYWVFNSVANSYTAKSNFMTFWDYALDPAWIAANYDKYYTSNAPGLLANIKGITNLVTNNPNLLVYADGDASQYTLLTDNVCPAPSYGFKPGPYQFTPPPVVDGSEPFFFYNYITAGGSPGNLIFTPGALSYYIVPVQVPPDPAGLDANAINAFFGFTPVPLTNATNPGDGLQFDPVTIPSFTYLVPIYGWVIIQQQGPTPFPPGDILISYSPVVDDGPSYSPTTLAAGTYSVDLGGTRGYVKAIIQGGG